MRCLNYITKKNNDIVNMLKIWIPASKDERNCGLAQGLPSKYNVTFTDGQLGKAATFNGSNAYISLPKSVDTTAKAFSIATFIKINSTGNSNCIYTQRTAVGGGFSLFCLSGKFRFDCGGSMWETGQGIQANTWYHVAATYDGSKKKFYLNGELVKETTATTTSQIGVKATIGGSEDSDNGVGNGNWMNGQLHDIRVYDHTLRDWEIKKIYNTKSFEMEGGLHLEAATNIAASLTPTANKGGWGAMQATKIDNGSYHLKHDYSSTGLSYWSTFVYIMPEEYANKTLTFSANIKNIRYANLNANTSWIFIGQGNDGQYPTHGSVTHYYKDMYEGMQIKWTGQLTNSGRYLIIELWNNDTDNNGYIEFDLYNIQIEEGENATPYTYESRTAWSTDSSCYKIDSQPYNIIKSGSSINFNGTDSAIKIPIAETITGGTWSINIWFYRPNGEWGTKNWETLIGGPSGFELSSKNGGSNTPQIRTYSWTNSGYTYECDKWNMVTLTRTPSGAKCYLNAELKHNGTAGNVPNNNYFIGAWASSTQQNFRGYMRRLTAYKKELSQEDINNLYIHNE